MKQCLNCGGDFSPKESGRQKYCSAVCLSRAGCKRFYAKRKKWFIARALKYQVANPERWRLINNKATKRYKDKTRFDKKRSEVFKIYKNRCVMCKTKRSLIIHHIDGVGYANSLKPNNDIKNLLLLCSSCHHKTHWAQRRSEITPEDIVRTYVKA